MTVRHSFEELLHEQSGFALGESSLDDLVVEGKGFTELHYHGERVVAFEDVEESDDVGVRGEEGHDLRLIFEAFAVGGIR